MIKKAAIIGIILILFLGGGVWFHLLSESGLNTSLTLVAKVTDGRVTVDRSEGRLLGESSLHGLFVTLDGFDLAIETVKLRWHPAQLLKGKLHIAELSVDDVRYGIKAVETEKTSEKSFITLPEVSLPITIQIDNIDIVRAKIYQDTSVQFPESLPIHIIDRLQAKLRGNLHRATIDSLELAAPDYGVKLSAGMRMVQSWPIELSANWWVKPEGFERIEGSVKGAGYLENPTVEVRIGQPFSVRIDGSLLNLFNDLSWDLTTSGAGINLSMFDAELPDCEAVFQLATSGTLLNYRVDGDSQLVCEQIPPTNLLLKLAGDSEQLTSTTVVSSGSEALINTTAEIGWRDGVSWDVNMSLQHNNLEDLFSVPVGTLSMDLTSSGRYQDQSLKHMTTISDFSALLTEGDVQLNGDISLEGSQHDLAFRMENFQVAESTIDGSGQIDFQQGVNWLANIGVAGFDPSQFGEYPAGEVAARFESTGAYHDGLEQLHVKIIEIAGTFAGRRVSGGGEVEHREGLSLVKGLYLENGKNRLKVDGRVAEQLDLSFSINGDDLAQLMPQLDGKLNGQGTIAGSPRLPLIEFTIDGSNLKYEDTTLKLLEGAFHIDLRPEGKTEGGITLGELEVAGSQIQSVTIKMDGDAANHQVDMQAVADNWNLGWTASGSYSQEDGWLGALNDFIASAGPYGIWKQQEETPIAFGPEGYEIRSFCLVEGDDRLCFDGFLQSDGEWMVKLRDTRFDILRFYKAGLLREKLSGSVEVNLIAQGEGNNLKSADAIIAVPEVHFEGQIQNYYPVFSWYDLKLTAFVDDGELRSNLSGWFIDGSIIEGRLTIPGFGRLDGGLANLPLEGELALNVKDLNPLSIITENYLVPSGTLLADLQVKGEVSNPELYGEMLLSDGLINFPQLGITASNINTEIDFKKQRIGIKLEAESGDGKATAVGSLEFFDSGWNGNFDITGDNAFLLNQNDIKLTADAELKLSMSEKGGKLSGKLYIPKALIQPDELSGSVTESSDVVIVDTLDEATAWPFDLDLNIGLGDEVKLDGYGLTGNLLGALQVANHPNKGMIGTGILYLNNGRFEIFARYLDISRGRIVFNGGPISNPDLDVSARKVISESGFSRSNKTVGVNIVGTVLDHEVTLFSIPQMTDSEIVTYLLLDKASVAPGESSGLLGTAVDAVGGSAGNKVLGDISQILPVDDVVLGGDIYNDPSLVVGKRLTKDLYISYDFSLVDNLGYFKVRYDFGLGFFLETKSSSESNGVDLFYSFER